MVFTTATFVSFVDDHAVLIAASFFTALALCIGYFIRARFQPGTTPEQKNCQQQPGCSTTKKDGVPSNCLFSRPTVTSGQSNLLKKNREKEWKTEKELEGKYGETLREMREKHGKGFDPSEAKTMLGGFGGCPVFHGMPKFEDVGKGSWPPGSDEDDAAPSACSESGGKGEGEVDLIDFCEHIPGQVKKTQQRVAMEKIEEGMTEEQKLSERQIQAKQLEDIFRLMGAQTDKFGVDNMDDIKNQMNLYIQ